MNQILLILDGILAKYFLERLCLQKTSNYHFDVVYYNEDSINLKLQSEYINFIKFDPSSASKLKELFLTNSYTQIFIHMKDEFDVKAVYDNIREINEEISVVLVDFWGLSINDSRCELVDVRSSLSEYLLAFLPDVPNFAQNIGLSNGEIMEVKIPAYSIFAHRHISSISQKRWRIALIYRNKKIIMPNPSVMIMPNDNVLLVGEPSILQNVYYKIKGGRGQFPSPFGNNLYLFLDMKRISQKELYKAYKTANILHSNTNSKRLFIHSINSKLCDFYEELKQDKKNSVTVHFDYENTKIKNIKDMLINDDIGLIIVDDSTFKKRKKEFYSLKIPILKLGSIDFEDLDEAIILSSNEDELENQAGVMIDLSKQLKLKALLYYYEPDNDSKKLTEHLQSLSQLYNRELKIINDKNKNPILELEHKKPALQFIYFKKDLLSFNLRSILSTNLNSLYYKMNKNYQVFIPIS